ncbi:MAG: hypothetical protein JWN93_2624 [Hyphomicrobiales bacterium]|jgi:hypothetical protein|nr:hypothetical protein [Hyphomicrobiales bacterium]
MTLVETTADPGTGLRAEIWEMDASGYAVCVLDAHDPAYRESFVFDVRKDAQAFAARSVLIRP